MAVLRVPAQFQTIHEAVDRARPGDSILVSNGVYRESVTVSKDRIRLIADGNRVVLNGSCRLATGFLLNEVSFVTIEGFAFRNFTEAAIRAQGGSGHRFVQNRIRSTPRCKGEGIDLQGSSRNLIWQNRLRGICIGVFITGSSSANRVVENLILEPE